MLCENCRLSRVNALDDLLDDALEVHEISELQVKSCNCNWEALA